MKDNATLRKLDAQFDATNAQLVHHIKLLGTIKQDGAWRDLLDQIKVLMARNAQTAHEWVAEYRKESAR